MKLRIKSNTIRLRLSQDEVKCLEEETVVTDRCAFPGSELVYAIELKGDIDQMYAEFSGQAIKVYMPESLVQNWSSNDTVGFDAHMQNGTYILVEKDFKCLIPRDSEDESALYPNPKA